MGKKKNIIIGCDSFSFRVMRLLFQFKNDIILIGDNNKIFENENFFLNKSLTAAVITKYNNIFENLNFVNKNIESVFICLPELLNESILLVSEFKELLVEKIYVEVDSDIKYEIFKKIGGVNVVYPGKDETLKILET
ncbi:hypothetical protein KA977_03075 [Candidatus Dependentiae bacterium]|nr:hypothetical protein [Candidatus Dependentiae bacterium]